MNIEQLHYIIEVAKTNSMSLAAQNLFVSRPAISQAINSLEEELQIKIFDRTRTGVFLTKEGTRIVERAQDVILKIQLLKEEASIQALNKRKELKLAICPSLFSITSELLLRYKQVHPDINIEITERGSWAVVKEVKEKNVDMGFTAIADTTMKNNEDELDFDILADGNMCVAVQQNSTLAGKKFVTPIDLKNQSIVIYQSDSLKSLFDDLKKKYGSINILFISNNMELIKKAVGKGVAITIFPDLSLKSDPLVLSGEILLIPLVEQRLENLFYTSAWSKNKHLPAEAKHFLQFFKTNFKRS
ncbi:LysR family transcriptional regulator [Bacillus dakarensis]|uniref:LysR family transcriptional regulator n=1 Tax=Robertmurraya dakarensis TaxID=1926278 RepID=UPI0009823D63|nr:LysR family transcriptional regulator [Bacillus dakarensis]